MIAVANMDGFGWLVCGCPQNLAQLCLRHRNFSEIVGR